MLNIKKLKTYLLEKKTRPFLLDDNNNGKTIMLSGAWGAGKTHFWQKEIAPDLSNKLNENNKACIYISLYGKDSLDSLKKEILIKASSEEQLISDEVATFGFDVLSAIKDSNFKIGQIIKAFFSLNNNRKVHKGTERLRNGGIICLDDFERKSKSIDLNDLFGFISQFVIELNCKIVIILNSDVFIGKESEVFRNVKEKTVNKFLYFEPTIDELFRSISKDTKYNALEEHKRDILNVILEIEELNARIYIQVLDNCLEWLNVKKTLDSKIIRVLVLGTFNFVLNHIVFIYCSKHKSRLLEFEELFFLLEDSLPIELKKVKFIEDETLCEQLTTRLRQNNLSSQMSVPQIDKLLNWVEENKSNLKILWKYGYKLHYVSDVNEYIYTEITQFIKSGILID